MTKDLNVKYTPTYRDELQLVRHFVGILEERLAGRDLPRKANVNPLDWCHLGMLGPQKEDHEPVELEAEQPNVDPSPSAPEVDASAKSTETSTKKEFPIPEAPELATSAIAEDAAPPLVADRGQDIRGTRRPPSALGFEMLLEPESGDRLEISIDASFCIFTKHLPTLKEQGSSLEIGPAEGAPLAEVTRRWPIKVNGIRFSIPISKKHCADDGGQVQSEVDRVLAEAFGQPDADRRWPSQRPRLSKLEALRDDASFSQFVASVARGLTTETWKIYSSVEIRTTPRTDGLVRIGCYIRNKTPETPITEKGRGQKDSYLVIGDASLHATVISGAIHPIEILPVPQDYQYDRRVWALGHNTSVKTNVALKQITTAALAVYEQLRVTTKTSPPSKFKQLSDSPESVLTAVYEAMNEYANDWKLRVIDCNALGLDSKALEECKRDQLGFIDEMRRFASGIAALGADPRLMQAFKAANRVFDRIAKGYDSWRLFQLVFIVTQLPALAIREGISSGEYKGQHYEWKDTLDWGDVLWFRTGGGKTEAYLGLSCCAMLYDRLRGKSFGMTAWLRFPLRMLSIQQLQRAMLVLWETEQERQRLLGSKAKDSDPIRLGYFVGGTVTPNALTSDILKQKYSTDESLESMRVVPDCPACGGNGTIKVTADFSEIRFRHTCTVCKAELPLDVSDDEVYRFLPTLVVGTIDKMASVGQQQKYGMLWGAARWKCPLHGYSFGKYCAVFECKDKGKNKSLVTAYDPAPALHIQDELHLLQEELGAFAGHYETLVRHCEEALSVRPCKVIAATATIEGFERQVQHLYGVKHARRFPGRGFDKYSNFYSNLDVDENQVPKTARFFVAFKTTSFTPADASAKVSEILHVEVVNLVRNPHLALAFLKDARHPEDAISLLTYYTTTLNYVGSLARGSRVHQALEDASLKVRPSGTRDFNVEYTSSRTTSAQVANLVHRIENPPAWDDPSFLDALVATNMISHGVDLERVNLMAMDGVPEQTAEYIQASSRSGRKHVGIVVVLLAEYSLRATSIYHRFLEYHDHLERMVSPVPVNRFAKYAAQRTMPGIVLGLVYGRHAAQRGQSGFNKRQEVANLFSSLGATLLEQLRSAYALGQGVYDERLEKSLSETLAKELQTIQLSIRNSHEANVRDAVKPSPMTSLRDVEIGVPFWPDYDSQLLTFVQRTRE